MKGTLQVYHAIIMIFLAGNLLKMFAGLNQFIIHIYFGFAGQFIWLFNFVYSIFKEEKLPQKIHGRQIHWNGLHQSVRV
jgi:hypothetical protein